MTKWRVVYSRPVHVERQGAEPYVKAGEEERGPLRDTPDEAREDAKEVGPNVMNLRLQRVELDGDDTDIR